MNKLIVAPPSRDIRLRRRVGPVRGGEDVALGGQLFGTLFRHAGRLGASTGAVGVLAIPMVGAAFGRLLVAPTGLS